MTEDKWMFYLIENKGCTYAGVSPNPTRRLRQHNGEIKGGARYTSRRRGWYPVLIIDGFIDMKSAMQCEWRLKHFARGNGSIRGVKGKLKYFSYKLIKIYFAKTSCKENELSKTK